MYFTQIYLKKNKKNQDFIIRFKHTLQRIPKDKRPNQPVNFGCFNNAMLANVKYTIKASRITTLEEAMVKAYEMEENMLGRNANLELILGKIKRQMSIFLVSPKCDPILQTG